MTWRQKNLYYLENDEGWTITRSKVKGEYVFELWKPNGEPIDGIFKTVDEVKQKAERL